MFGHEGLMTLMLLVHLTSINVTGISLTQKLVLNGDHTTENIQGMEGIGLLRFSLGCEDMECKN